MFRSELVLPGFKPAEILKSYSTSRADGRIAVLRLALIGVASGLLTGIAVGAVMTLIDWRLNPGGIFRDSAGTHWRVVFDTAWTWFWPVTLLVASLVTAVVSFVEKR